MDKIFLKKIKNLFNKKQFNQIKFEISTLTEDEKKNPFIYNTLGILEIVNKNLKVAKSLFNKALRLDPYYLHSLLNLAKISYLDKDFYHTIQSLENYNNKFPNTHEVILNLANLTFAAGYINETIYYHKQLIDSKKYNIKDLTAFIFLLNYSSTYSNETYKKYSDLFNEYLHKEKKNFLINPNECDRFKVGFLSYDLRDHSVGYFLKDFIIELKAQNFIPIGLNLSEEKEKNFTTELKKTFSEWHDIGKLNDEELSNFILEKKMFFLIDLAGYSTNNRLQVFKNKPVPVQISWLGYCNTTGLKEIDYLIADNNVITEEDEKSYNEKIIRLPKIWNTLSKLEKIEANQLPYIKNKTFTFGSFNNFLKISDKTIEMWDEILFKVKNSRLVLKNSVHMDRNFKNYILKKFKSGINQDRLIILDYQINRKDHLKQYLNIDLSLDTYPYNGVTTTFESLWMGVPVVTLKGETFVSRCGYSINKNADLIDFVAKNKDEYISIATNFALNPGINKLIDLRKKLRSLIVASPLFDNTTFAKNFAEKLIQISNYS